MSDEKTYIGRAACGCVCFASAEDWNRGDIARSVSQIIIDGGSVELVDEPRRLEIWQEETFFKCPHEKREIEPIVADSRAAPQVPLFDLQGVDGVFDKADWVGMPKRRMRGPDTIATVDGVSCDMTVYRMLDSQRSTAYGCRIYFGDPVNGPHQSQITDLYYDQRGALSESLQIVSMWGVDPSRWSAAVGLAEEVAV